MINHYDPNLFINKSVLAKMAGVSTNEIIFSSVTIHFTMHIVACAIFIVIMFFNH